MLLRVRLITGFPGSLLVYHPRPYILYTTHRSSITGTIKVIENSATSITELNSALRELNSDLTELHSDLSELNLDFIELNSDLT